MEKLSPGQIFNKTSVFVLLKIALSVVSFVISIIILSIVASITKNAIIEIVIWLILTAAVTFAIDYFVGYIVKAGHVAAITDAVTVGMIPDDMLNVSRQTVQERFPTCNAYFAYRHTLNGTLNQVQKSVNVFGSRYAGNVIVRNLISFLQIFVGMALSFAGDCCLAYTFWRDGKGLYTSTADAIAVYFQCWKRILENALFIAVEIIVAVVLIFIFLFCIFAPCFTSIFDTNIMAGALGAASLGFFASYAVKSAIIDTYFMINVTVSFFEEAKYAELTDDEYAQVCRTSPKYRSLFAKAQSELAASSNEASTANTTSGNVPPAPPKPPIR